MRGRRGFWRRLLRGALLTALSLVLLSVLMVAALRFIDPFSSGFMLQAPRMVIFPGLAIMLAVLGFNMLADGLCDWVDPQRARCTM